MEKLKKKFNKKIILYKNGKERELYIIIKFFIFFKVYYAKLYPINTKAKQFTGNDYNKCWILNSTLLLSTHFKLI